MAKLAVFLLLCIILATGCMRSALFWGSFVDHSVKENAALHGGYELGALYELRRSCFLLKKQIDSTAPILQPPSSETTGGLFDAPETIGSYSADPKKYQDVLGIVSVGTRLKVVDFRERGFRRTGTWLGVVVEISSGQFAGKRVELGDLSLNVQTPEYLEWRSARHRASGENQRDRPVRSPLVPKRPDNIYLTKCEAARK